MQTQKILEMKLSGPRPGANENLVHENKNCTQNICSIWKYAQYTGTDELVVDRTK